MASLREKLKRIPSLFLLGVALLVLGACGDSEEQAIEDITLLKKYYRASPPPPGWKVNRISANSDGTYRVEILITSESDVHYIKTLSRMSQFKVAKKACPPTHSAAADSIDHRVWVHLTTKAEELTSSICPQ